MEFKLMLEGVEIGRSRLDRLDDGMGIATGDFQPSVGYARVKAIFRRLSDAVETRHAAVDLWRERDLLDLRVVAPDGATVSVASVMIYDFDIEGACELEVKLLDLQQWELLSRDQPG